jgi:hypothetical protein
LPKLNVEVVINTFDTMVNLSDNQLLRIAMLEPRIARGLEPYVRIGR